VIRLLISLLLVFQATVVGPVKIAGPVGLGGGGPLAYNTYTYVVENGSSVASITSPSITLPNQARVIVFCRDGSGSSHSITATSTPANTFTALSSGFASGVGNAQFSYALTVGAVATTFTCTPPSSQQYQGMVVVVWTGGPGIADGPSQTATTGFNPATATFSTATAVEIVWECVSGASNAGWTVGAIGGTTAILGGISNTPLVGGTSADAACEYRITSSLISSGTANLSHGAGTDGVGIVAAFQ